MTVMRIYIFSITHIKWWISFKINANKIEKNICRSFPVGNPWNIVAPTSYLVAACSMAHAVSQLETLVYVKVDNISRGWIKQIYVSWCLLIPHIFMNVLHTIHFSCDSCGILNLIYCGSLEASQSIVCGQRRAETKQPKGSNQYNSYSLVRSNTLHPGTNSVI